MQRGFIRYVQGGEKNFAEPAWIMGGLTTNPFRLIYRFFVVALYGVGLHLRQATYLGMGIALAQSASVLASAVRIIWRPLVDEFRR